MVEADLTKELPKEYIFTSEEEGELDVVIKYSYPWLPPRCSCCHKWGHLQTTCLTAVAKNTQDHQPTEAAALMVESVNKALLVADHTLDDKSSDSPKAATVVEETSMEEKDKEQEQGWITPKHGRSPGKRQEGLKFGEVSILSNSYSALSGEEESGEETKNDGNNKAAELMENKDSQPEASLVVTKEALGPIKPKGGKAELSLRPSLPRESKTAHKIVSNPSTQSTRDRTRDQSKRIPPKHL